MEFKPPATVSFNTGNTAETWRRWEQQFRIYFEAAELATKPPKTQAGPEAQDIFANFVFANTADDKDTNWEHVLKKFKTYCEPGKMRYLNGINSGSATNVKGITLISGSMIYGYY